jgi:hypothetical protein
MTTASAHPRAYEGHPLLAPLATLSGASGSERLVAAMEHVDRVVNAFSEDIGRAVANIRAEVASERDAALSQIAAARRDVAHEHERLHRDRESFEAHREKQEADLELRWTELRREQEKEKAERTRAERELREASARATAETQAAALVQMQAAQAAQAASYGFGGGFGEAALGPGPGPAEPREAATYGGFPGGARGEGAVRIPPDGGGSYPYPYPDPYAYAHAHASSSSARGVVGVGEKPPPGASVVLALGGLRRADAPTRAAEAYEPGTGGWKTLPEMSTPRGYLAVAAKGRGDGALAIGGSDGRNTLSSVEVRTISFVMDVLLRVLFGFSVWIFLVGSGRAPPRSRFDCRRNVAIPSVTYPSTHPSHTSSSSSSSPSRRNTRRPRTSGGSSRR